MKKNMGNADKIMRILFAVIIGALYLMGHLQGTVAIILLVFAGVFLLTSLAGTCPLYTVFGITTRRVKDTLTYKP